MAATASSLPLRRLAQHARATPESVAVRAAGRAWTYAELDEQSNALAWRLHEAGVGPEQRVAILARRSYPTLVGLIGILKAGAAYVPLEESGSHARRAGILTDARARPVLAHGVAPAGIEAIDLDDVGERRAEPPPVRLHARNAAYVVFTSGSTGRPKGVVVEHRSLDNFVRWAVDWFDVGPDARFLQWSSLVADGHIWEIFVPLAAGASLRLLASDEEAMRVERLEQILADERITHMDVVASVLTLMQPPLGAAVRWCMTGGEAVPASVVERWSSAARTVVNGYGATEVTNLSHAHACVPDGRDPPLGQPIGGCWAYVLDAQLGPVTEGIGEIYLAGVGVARGYESAPALTAERFVPDPWAPGERMYRTGDFASVDADGEVRFAGRVDDQVQIAGHRVEPGEVEAAIRRQPGTREAAVVSARDTRGAERLVAFVVGDGRGLRDALRRALPDYLVPHRLLAVDALPRAPSGKVDRRRLAERARDIVAQRLLVDADSAGGTLEEALLDAVAHVVGRTPDPSDRFIDLGGDSLDAMHVSARVWQRTGVRISLSALLGDEPLTAAVAARPVGADAHGAGEAA